MELGLTNWDYLSFGSFFVVLSIIGFWAGRKERTSPDEYFLAGRKLPWYVVGGSFIASNISSEHFVGMIGAAVIYGQCVSLFCWGNIGSFSFLIWLFIPFLLASRVFTVPEFIERRFNVGLRQMFALVTVVSNVVAFLAAVLYGGALAIQKLFGSELAALTDRLMSFWPSALTVCSVSPQQAQLWVAIVILAVVAGAWAIYGGLSSVAWTDLFTVVVMVCGGLVVTLLGLKALAGESGSVIDGWNTMIECNRAEEGVWAEAVRKTAPQIISDEHYDRLSVYQPSTHQVVPWIHVVFGVLSISIWYNVLNQFMIQRVLGAKDAYHARMGIVFAGFAQILMPLLVVVPGMIFFAMHPQILLLPWEEVRPEADKTFVHMVQTLVPVGVRGLVLAALFGAIQSTINSVLNSTATIVTLDFYKRLIHPSASGDRLVRVGIITSVVVLVVAIVLAGFVGRFGSLFVYIQTLYAFFAPPFAAIFLLGILWRRINSAGATTAVLAGFAFGIAIKLFVHYVPSHPAWLEPFGNQAAINWSFCVVVCIAVSLVTTRPPAEKITDQLIVNWKKLNIFDNLGEHWYGNVAVWWGVFAVLIVILIAMFSPLMLS